MKRRALFLAVIGLALVPAVALAAAAMRSPRTASLGSRVSVSASGFKPGRYTLWLGFKALAGGASPTYCVGRIGPAVRPVDGKLRISGTLPSRLGCYQGVGEVEGYRRTAPGSSSKYFLTLGDSFHPNGFDADKSFVVHPIRITR